MTRTNYRALLFASFLIPITLFVYLDFLAPRPFYLFEIDAENAIYYDAALLYAGQPLSFISHPGTPIFYLASFILAITGPDLDAFPRFLITSHLIAALLASISLCAFVWAFLRTTPIGISALAVSSILAWPSVIFFLDYFDTVSFVLPFGLLAVSLFWSNLKNGESPNRVLLALSGMVLGLCLAIKLSFVPVAVALLVACSIQILPSLRVNSRKWKSMFVMPLGIVFSFLLCTAPIFGRLPNTILGLVDTAPIYSELPRTFLQAFGILLRSSLPLALLIVVGVAAFLYLFASYIYRCLKVWRTDSQRPQEMDNFAYLAGGVFISLMLLAFVYTMAMTELGPDPGMDLRNVAPCALVFPFLVLFCYRLFSARRSSSLNRSVQAFLVVTAIAVAAYPAIRHLEHRREFIRSRSQTLAQTINRLEELRQPDSRIAFWDNMGDGLLGEVDFHFEANYGFANDYFDSALLQKYPHWTLFRLTETPRLIQEKAQGKPKLGPPGASFGRFGILWRRLFPHPYSSSDELVAGETSGMRVSLIAVPAKEFRNRLDGIPESEFLDLIDARLGTPRIWQELIGGVDWVLIDVSGTPRKSAVYTPKGN